MGISFPSGVPEGEASTTGASLGCLAAVAQRPDSACQAGSLTPSGTEALPMKLDGLAETRVDIVPIGRTLVLKILVLYA